MAICAEFIAVAPVAAAVVVAPVAAAPVAAAVKNYKRVLIIKFCERFF